MAREASADDLKASARDAAEEVGKHARRAADEAREAAETVKEKGAEFYESAREKGAEYVEHARERGHDYAERARDEAKRLYRQGERRAGEVAAHAEEYYDEVSEVVRRNPAQALGIAAGVGFLLGLIIARR